MRKTNQWLPFDDFPGIPGREVPAGAGLIQLVGTVDKSNADTPGVLMCNGTRIRAEVERLDAQVPNLIVNLMVQTVPGGGWALVSSTACPGPAGNVTIIAPPDTVANAVRLEAVQDAATIFMVRVGLTVAGN